MGICHADANMVREISGIKHTQHENGNDSEVHGRAPDILDERYAGGEISREEYLRMQDEIVTH